MDNNITGNHLEPVPAWFVTGERTQIKNRTLKCPNCDWSEYVVSVRGNVAYQGERRGVLLDDTHCCGHCNKPYGIPVEVE